MNMYTLLGELICLEIWAFGSQGTSSIDFDVDDIIWGTVQRPLPLLRTVQL